VLLFEDGEGHQQAVSLEVFGSFMAAHSPPLECVVLNACSTVEQGKFLAYNIPYVIAMRAPVEDELAIQFSRGFYDAIAAGKPIEFAYEEGRRCVQLITSAEADLPILVRQTASEKYQRQPLGVRSAEYDRWYAQLTAGKLEVKIDPRALNEIDVLLAILDKVLLEAGFDKGSMDRVAVAVWELIANVARHVTGSSAIVSVEVNKRHLPMVILSVADQGPGFDLFGTIRTEYVGIAGGEPEHGLGRVRRFSDDVSQSRPSEFMPFHKIFCTIYSVPPPVSVFDRYPWCAKVVVVVESPYSVWFGDSRYALWGTLAVTETLDAAVRAGVPQLLDLYLSPLRTSSPAYIGIEVLGSRFPTDSLGERKLGERKGRGLLEILGEAVGRYFRNLLEDRRVIIVGPKRSELKAGFERELGHECEIRDFATRDECLHALGEIDKTLREG
jgi:anti-sigma regulatory factor (Ser/Thr protein kinase)